MKKTQFFKKKLENFLKNSMHRNSSGSVKKPSGAQKKACSNYSQYRKYCVVKTVSKGQPCHPRKKHCKTGENTICTLLPGFGRRGRRGIRY